MKIGIGCDHAGYKLKELLKNYLEKQGHEIKDFGTYSEESTDYADYGHPLAEAVESKTMDKGVAICGSGNGINITVNKHQKIRAALCWDEEIAKLARQHNDANICTLPARFIEQEKAINIIDVFLNTEFEGGRHSCRVEKIPIINK